jgi:hypothetical protein
VLTLTLFSARVKLPVNYEGRAEWMMGRIMEKRSWKFALLM